MSRVEGLILVAAYVAFVAVIWVTERHPPVLGETGELAEAAHHDDLEPARSRVGRELGLVLAGVAAMALGASALVEGVRRLTDVEATRTKLGLTIVGFATAFELVVLAWSAARRVVSAAVVAGVIGSFTYNATMTLGASALARPLRITDAASLHGPWLAMLASIALVVALTQHRQALTNRTASYSSGATRSSSSSLRPTSALRRKRCRAQVVEPHRGSAHLLAAVPKLFRCARKSTGRSRRPNVPSATARPNKQRGECRGNGVTGWRCSF